MTLKDVMDADIKTVFLNADDFADEFVNDRTILTINALFDNEFIVVVDDVESTTPAITVADTDVLGVQHNDLFTDVVTSIVYKLVGIQPDGTGFTLLVLSQD